jgi:MFS family permease
MPATEAGLPERGAQTRNVFLFGVNTGLFYLASPVLLVGNLQAALCSKLHASDTVANLPGSAYLIMAASPVVVAWLFPQAALLKRVLVVGYAVLALMGATTAAVLLLPFSDTFKVAIVVLQGAVTGSALTTVTMFLFEVLGRGVVTERRGIALGLGYGVGPVFAVVGSLASQLVLDGKVGPVALPGIEYPWGFVIIFAASAPIMALAAILSTCFVIPQPPQELVRQRFFSAVFGGLGDFLGNRVLRLTTIVAVLIFSGYTIGANLTLYTPVALGESADKYVGYQLALRFTFKVLSGLFGGWLLTRTHPKAGLLTTASFGLSGVVWALASSGTWFLLSFGLLGAGELFGVYVTNYILCCSSQAKTRRNMGFASMMMLPAAPAGALFGAVSDYFGSRFSQSFGLQLSFALAAAYIGTAIVLALLLPARPRPEAERGARAPLPRRG